MTSIIHKKQNSFSLLIAENQTKFKCAEDDEEEELISQLTLYVS